MDRSSCNWITIKIKKKKKYKIKNKIFFKKLKKNKWKKDGQIFQTKYQQGYCVTEQYPRWNGLNWYIENFHPKEAKYTFFSNAQGTFSKIDQMIGHKTSHNKFKKIEIISSIFSDHKGLKLEKKISRKKPQNTKKHGDWIACYSTINGWKMRLRETSKSFWKQIKMNSQKSKTNGTQQRHSWEGSL